MAVQRVDVVHVGRCRQIDSSLVNMSHSIGS